MSKAMVSFECIDVGNAPWFQVVFMAKSPIPVLFDARMLGYSGIGTQVQSVLDLLIDRPEVQLTLAGHPETIQKSLPDFSGEIRPFTAPIYSIREQLTFPAPRKGEIIHSPHYNGALKYLRRSLVVVHDLIHLDSQEFSNPIYRFYASFFLRQVSAKAAAIATVSDYSRTRLEQNFPAAANRVQTIHNGINHRLFRPAAARTVADFRRKYQLKRPFALCVGIGKKHKNVDFVVRSLNTLWDGGLELDLCIAGTGGKLPAYLKEAILESHKERVRILPFFEMAELPILYSSATMFIMPSLLEGFGFPLAEAMACGTPVLSSNRSSLPEVGGDVPIY
ncbi:MAG: glycosyltransferase family 4 protein, partial [Leptospiraceae bacterium]|nr:glycosyltransferase family 4 protein [Leptospiraceae bacterium]